MLTMLTIQKQQISLQTSTIPTLLMTQGKLISQMIAYIWRWADDHTDEKGKYARDLKVCFERIHRRFSAQSKSHKLQEQHSSNALEILLTVDARKYLLEREQINQEKLKNFTEDEQQAAELLINIFGKDRIRNLTNYLSPIFQPEAVDMRNNSGNNTPFPVYQFHIDTSSFIGILKDPDLEDRLIFKYMISYPPSPKFSEATVTTTELEQWIENTDDEIFRPESAYIPVSTS